MASRIPKTQIQTSQKVLDILSSNDVWYTKSHPITSQKVLDILYSHNVLENGKILDLGAGEGFFSSLLYDYLSASGHNGIRERIAACDLFPQTYKFDKIACDLCDFNASFPYKNESFQAVCSIEVLEHLENIFHFIREIHRILKAGGVAVITTPNILNLNSRLKSFVTGFPLLYDPLPLRSNDPRDLGGHINGVTFYYLAYMLERAGFRNIKLHTDKEKDSAKLLSYLLKLPIKLAEKILFRKMRRDNRWFDENKQYLQQINSNSILRGRTIILEAVKA
jgi:2-polyprenyl-3-methyl-5-hydroxy-6-metoxy-1,4-benzoquinol methylase